MIDVSSARKAQRRIRHADRKIRQIRKRFVCPGSSPDRYLWRAANRWIRREKHYFRALVRALGWRAVPLRDL